MHRRLAGCCAPAARGWPPAAAAAQRCATQHDEDRVAHHCSACELLLLHELGALDAISPAHETRPLGDASGMKFLAAGWLTSHARTPAAAPRRDTCASPFGAQSPCSLGPAARLRRCSRDFFLPAPAQAPSQSRCAAPPSRALRRPASATVTVTFDVPRSAARSLVTRPSSLLAAKDKRRFMIVIPVRNFKLNVVARPARGRNARDASAVAALPVRKPLNQRREPPLLPELAFW